MEEGRRNFAELLLLIGRTCLEKLEIEYLAEAPVRLWNARFMMIASRTPAHWMIAPRDERAEEILQRELGIGALAAATLVQRGFTDVADAEKVLEAPLDGLHDPKLLPDYDAAASEILGAISRKERIYVHGDYDVDGVTSAAIITRFLKSVGADVVVHVPHRIKEGYGIHALAIQDATDCGAKLFLTCDCGISAHTQVQAARDAGMRVVVTDHHDPRPELPNAHAIVNPHRADSQYPFPLLSGAGVAFKLCAGLTQDLGYRVSDFYRAFMDLACMGTVADVVSLTDENRIIVKHGLGFLGQTKKPGIRALINLALNGMPTEMKSTHISFQLAPRLNAAGRLSDSAISLRLLLESDPVSADGIARELEELNKERRVEQKRMVDEAMLEAAEAGYDQDPVLVIAREGWHHGIIGLVAGKLTEGFTKPSFVVGYEKGQTRGKGSARSIPGFHLADAIRSLHPLLEGGGHELAAGFSVDVDRVEELRAALVAYARQMPDFSPGVRTVAVTAEVSAEEADMRAVEEMVRLEPFGEGNPTPIFGTYDMTVHAKTPLGKDGNHVRLGLLSPAGSLREINCWHAGEDIRGLELGERIHIAFEPFIDTFNNNRSLRYKLRDFVRA
jgi:single-stranded-DNA-specific exonuclease